MLKWKWKEHIFILLDNFLIFFIPNIYDEFT